VRVKPLGFLLNAEGLERLPVAVEVLAAHVQHRLRPLWAPAPPGALHPILAVQDQEEGQERASQAEQSAEELAFDGVGGQGGRGGVVDEGDQPAEQGSQAGALPISAACANLRASLLGAIVGSVV